MQTSEAEHLSWEGHYEGAGVSGFDLFETLFGGEGLLTQLDRTNGRCCIDEKVSDLPRQLSYYVGLLIWQLA